MERNIFTLPCISCDTINEYFTFKWYNTLFGDIAEDGAYVPVNLSRDYLEDLYVDYKEMINEEAFSSAQMTENTIEFIEKMNELGFYDEILVYCYY